MIKRVLVLDDEPGVVNALQRTLRRCFAGDNLHIETFTDPEQALLRCGEVDFDVAISDYRMPSFNGVDFLKMVKHIQPHAVRVVLSASTEFNVVMSAVNDAEVFRFIAKPWTDEELQRVLQLAFERAVSNKKKPGGPH